MKFTVGHGGFHRGDFESRAEEMGEKALWAGPVGKARPLESNVPGTIGTAVGLAGVG